MRNELLLHNQNCKETDVEQSNNYHRQKGQKSGAEVWKYFREQSCFLELSVDGKHVHLNGSEDCGGEVEEGVALAKDVESSRHKTLRDFGDKEEEKQPSTHDGDEVEVQGLMHAIFTCSDAGQHS